MKTFIQVWQQVDSEPDWPLRRGRWRGGGGDHLPSVPAEHQSWQHNLPLPASGCWGGSLPSPSHPARRKVQTAQCLKGKFSEHYQELFSYEEDYTFLHWDFHVIQRHNIFQGTTTLFWRTSELLARLSTAAFRWQSGNILCVNSPLTYITIMCILFRRGKDLIKTREQGQAQAPQRPWLNKSLVAVKEQGMLFHFNPSEMEVTFTFRPSLWKTLYSKSYIIITSLSSEQIRLKAHL